MLSLLLWWKKTYLGATRLTSKREGDKERGNKSVILRHQGLMNEFNIKLMETMLFVCGRFPPSSYLTCCLGF